ncbi:MAG: helix-turn-helix domain-containing protein [Bacteroidales bacterium]|nr:helix-turn-helix domain-containing protein [Bacteroidales bacterium]
MEFTKPMTKAELADYLGVSRSTLLRWLKLLNIEKIEGYQKKSRILTPAVLKVITEKLCV